MLPTGLAALLTATPNSVLLSRVFQYFKFQTFSMDLHIYILT